MTGPRVVLVGDANVDMVIRLPDRAAGRPDLSASVPQLFGGGSVANAAVALARLAVPVSFVGTVGDDGYGRWVRDEMAGAGVDMAALCMDPDSFTPTVIVLIEPNGERLPVIWPNEGGAHTRLCLDDIPPDLITGAAWLHTTGMCLGEAPARDALLHALALAHEAGVPVSFDLNLRLELWGWRPGVRAAVERAITLADVVLGSGPEEIAPLTGVADVGAAARALSQGQRTVIARLGGQGALAVGPSEEVHVPVFAARVIDMVGAGDAFDAGFIAARLAGHDLREAVRWGHAAAAVCVGQHGARLDITPERLRAVLNSG